MAGWSDVLKQLVAGAECDYYMFNNAQQLPQNLPRPVAEYDFQLVQIPLRSIVPDEAYYRLSYGDTAAYETLFNVSLRASIGFSHWRCVGTKTMGCSPSSRIS